MCLNSLQISDRWIILCENKTAATTTTAANNNDSQVAYMVWLWIGADERKPKKLCKFCCCGCCQWGFFFRSGDAFLQTHKWNERVSRYLKREQWTYDDLNVKSSSTPFMHFTTTNTQDTSYHVTQVHCKKFEFRIKIGSKMLTITSKNRIKWLEHEHEQEHVMIILCSPYAVVSCELWCNFIY